MIDKNQKELKEIQEKYLLSESEADRLIEEKD